MARLISEVEVPFVPRVRDDQAMEGARAGDAPAGVMLMPNCAALVMTATFARRVAAALGIRLLGVLTLFAHLQDKQGAREGTWRTLELHRPGLLGGWLGAGVAHRVGRRKSSEASFRFVCSAAVACDGAGPGAGPWVAASA